MKRILTLPLVFVFTSSGFSQGISKCEVELNTSVSKLLPVNNVWNESGNSYTYDKKKNMASTVLNLNMLFQ